jgi:WD40 repeat protein
MKLEKVREIDFPTGVLGLAASSDFTRLYVSCIDGQVFEADATSGATTPFAGKHGSFASSCALLPDGQTLVSAGYDGCLVWHDVKTRAEIRRIKAHDFWSWRMALSPDGARVATVTGQYLAGGEKYEPAPAAEPTVKVFDAKTGELLQKWDHIPPVLSLAFSPDSQKVAAGNLMGDVHIWNVANGEKTTQFKTPDFTCWGIIKSPHYIGGIYGLAFAPDGRSILCCGMGPMTDPMAGNGKMTWQRWSLTDAAPKMLDQVHDGEHGSGLMEALANTPDGQAFLMAGRQAQGTWNVAMFNSADGKLATSLDTKSRVTQAIFAADGKTLYLSAVNGQPKRNEKGEWPSYGRILVVTVTA